MGKRKSIPAGADPLGAILGVSETTSPFKVIAEVGRPVKDRPKPKKRIAFDVSEELAEKIRDCVMHLSGPPLHLNLSRFAETAFLREIERLERDQNGGEAFPRRMEEPRPGRPLG